ncbi:MAG: hypothetical protein FJ403_24360, partial [Verrucomicrobia bacterium]|nr:hypothetical protein [Verrucomicrobiota bacterium]
MINIYFTCVHHGVERSRCAAGEVNVVGLRWVHASLLGRMVPGSLLTAGPALGPVLHCQNLPQAHLLAVQHGMRAEKHKPQHQHQHLRQHRDRFMMVAMFQMIILSQFIEGLVFD